MATSLPGLLRFLRGLWAPSLVASLIACTEHDDEQQSADAAPQDAKGVDSPDSLARGDADEPEEPGAPSLVALSVTAASSTDGGAPATLVPDFSPSVHDYSVRCAAGMNSLTVSMTASPGANSLLLQPTPSPTLPQQTLYVSASEGAAVVAAATNGLATAEYWVRCLPHDFPEFQWTPHAEGGAPPAGYTLIGTLLPGQGRGYAMILDSNGVPVWYTPASETPGASVVDVDDVVAGAVSFYSSADPPDTEFEVHRLSPLSTTYAEPANTSVDLHELRLLPNGDYLVISAPMQSGIDLTGMQVATADGGISTLNGPQTILTCNLVEFAPNGLVSWSWNILDHFDPVADSVYPQPFGMMNGAMVYDPFHCNSIDVDPNNGNLLVSARQMASIFYVEKPSGRVLWKMGGATPSKDGATYLSVPDPFALQHDARLQPDWSPSCGGGAGHITLYDNEVVGESKNARGVEYAVTIGPNPVASQEQDAGDCGGDATTPANIATVAWQYAGTAPSRAMGSFRIRPDGSRIIGWGLILGAGFTEVDQAGNDLVDFEFADRNVSYRALPAPLSAFDLGTLRAMAGRR